MTRAPFTSLRPLLLAVATLACLPLSACTHDGFGSLEGHYTTFALPEPKGRTVHVCHAYGCRQKTKFRFTDEDMAELGAIMKKWRSKADTAEDERRGIAYAIGWIETRVGKAIGTDTDRAGMDFAGSGDLTQQDCVDEATNTTSYLRVLAEGGLLRHHTVDVPFAKENYLRGISGWTHWTAVIKERATPQKWAVDSWIYANGENPAIERTEEWYIASLEELPKPKR